MDKKLEQAMSKAFDVMSKNSIDVTYQPSHEGHEKDSSKIGGKPSLPKDFQWPYYEGKSYDGVVANRPLAFLAEIHLAETAEFDVEGLLPKSGVISFFYEIETEKWGFDPKDKGCGRAFYFENEETLNETEFPDDLHEDYRFPEFLMSFAQRVSLPSYGDFYGTSQEKEISQQFPEETDACEWDEYDTLKEQYGCAADGWGECTRLLGYPDVIQNPMEWQCEAVSRGIYMGNEHEKFSGYDEHDNPTYYIQNGWIKPLKNWLSGFSFCLLFPDPVHILLFDSAPQVLYNKKRTYVLNANKKGEGMLWISCTSTPIQLMSAGQQWICWKRDMEGIFGKFPL